MDEILRLTAAVIAAVVLYFSLGRIYRAKYGEASLHRMRSSNIRI